MKYYLVYGDGCDYIVIDGLWVGEDVARSRAEFLNNMGDTTCKNYLCLDWDYKEMNPLQTDIFRVPDRDSGWFTND